MKRSATAFDWSIACSTLWLAACAGEADPGPPAALRSAEHGGSVLLDPHQDGRAPALALAEVGYGRLVDLYDRDATSGEELLQHADLVVDPELAGDAVDYLFESAADRTRLVVLHPAGSPAFDAALTRACGNLPALAEGGAVPRDAVLSLCFDDLLDAQRIPSISVGAGGAPLGVRLLLDPNHGGFADLDGDGRLELHPTRVIVDPVASRLARLRDGEGSASGAGWPAEPAGGAQLELSVSTAGRGAREVSLAFRSEGFLAASGRPRILGEQRIDVLRIQPLGGQRFVASYQFEVAACRALPERGDLIEFVGAAAEVLGSHAHVDPATGVISGVQLYLLAGLAAALIPGPASYVAPFDAASDVPECFVTFSIPPLAPPAAGISSHAGIEVRFSRPMDPASVEALQTFALERDWPVPPLEERVVGAIQAAPDGTRFALVPSLPLATDAPTSPAAYVFDLDGSPAGVTAADGTPLAQDLPPVRFELDPSQPAQSNSGIVLEFDVQDEDGNGSPELRGQFLFDFVEERIEARPVQRFSAATDPSQGTVSYMAPVAAVTTPLVPLGSKLMSVWRYCDLGFSLLDEAYHNIDVEGLYWSPDLGQPFADQFAEFQMSLGHAGFLPDEGINSGLLPEHPSSGLQGTFDQNYLDPTLPVVVHPKATGYTIDPLDLTASAFGLPLMPWPLNRGIPISQYSFWTFRDTAIQAVGGPNGEGADPLILVQVLETGVAIRGFYPENEVPTIGLPLLTEFRTYPDPGAQGSNALHVANVAFAINSSPMPFFRAHSSGGISSSGTVSVDPDQEPVASGGIGAGGVPTPPLDKVFYYGQADFVVRVSRAHTVWFDAQGALAFGTPVLEPVAPHQPPGTSVALAFRGATGIASQVPQIWATTEWLGPYGDSFTFLQIVKLAPGVSVNPDESFTVTYLNGDPTWKSQLADLDGARYVQARISMIANPETGAIPTVSGLGLPFAK